MAESQKCEQLQMPQEMAQKLYEECALLIIAGLPKGTELGVDFSANKVDRRFRGIKMIPPGPHFIYTAATEVYGDTAARVGFIHYFKKQEIVIYEWNNQTEELKPRPSAKIEVDRVRIRGNLAEIDKFLAPYDYQQLKKWQQLTNHITDEVIQFTTPECGSIRSSAEFQSCPDSDRPKGQSPLTDSVTIRPNQTEDELLPNLKIVPETALRFNRIPVLHSKSASPAQISQSHLDSKNAIEKYFSTFSEPCDVIRELQLSFVLFLCGCSVDALAHWRKLLGLLSKSGTSVPVFKPFYRRYLEILKTQLPELPEELMMPTSNNTVFKDVGKLIFNCTLNGLKDEADAFGAYLTREMSWHFDDIFDEDPDDFPVVVEL